MLGSAILDVAIGLIVLFLLLSLVASALREAVESIMKSRAVLLERGVRELLGDPEGTGLTTAFYRHPLIASLYDGEYTPVRERRRGASLPTYIPSRNFALALMDLAVRPPGAHIYAAARRTSAYTIPDLRAGGARLPNAHVRRAMLVAVDASFGDVRQVQANLEAWFDSAMDRVSGWYKRKTHWHLFAIGLALTGALHVNTVGIANHLWRDRAAREAIVNRGRIILEDSTYAAAVRDTTASAAALRERYEDVASLDLPLTWRRANWPPADTGAPGWLWWALVTLTGFAITAAAITLGAPFWFDLLNKVMVIRSTVKPHEKSGEEGSEDRRAEPQPSPPPGSAPRAAAPTGPVAAATAATAAPGGEDPGFEPREWAMGDPDEGVL